MSTDMQQYSLQNQATAIALYAARRGYSIVRTYEDAGKSGLSADRRTGLQSLLLDVRMGGADYGVILVLDVSRWGRFQDSDESAHYEYMCKEAGVRVEYCAELFENDGSLAATVLKNIKRAMAGEFSRELSAKVFAGQSRSVSNGFFVGSKPGYGLRRCIVDERGYRKFELKPGQRKAITTDRTILVPGPADEIETIRDVYAMFIDRRLPLCQIARRLNERGTLNAEGRPWTDVAIKELLSNEKYIGSSVFNRTSKKLNTRYRKNLSADWIRTSGAFDPIVPIAQFQKAQVQLARNARGYTDNEMLDSLSAIWCSIGRLSAGVLETASVGPRVNAYKEHFGSLVEAYRKIGYPGHYSSGRGSDIRRVAVKKAITFLTKRGCCVTYEWGSSQFVVDDELRIAFVTGASEPACLKNSWLISTNSRAKPDILVAVRVDKETSAIQEYLLIPTLFLQGGMWLSVTAARDARLKDFCSSTLEPLYRLCLRAKLAR